MQTSSDSYDFYTTKAINNKRVRYNELKILRKPEDVEKQLYFEFGENELNRKKRYYNDLKTLNEDFEYLSKIKKQIENNKEKDSDLKRKLDSEDTDEEETESISRKFKKNNL